MNKEYILLAGYRRYNAIKKLGWKKITANVYGEDKVIEIYVDDIDFGDNSRKDEQSSEIIELMSSIKQNGLIQPIVVAKSKNLTEEDFLALNLTENLQRKDLNPLEISFRLKRLLKLGLNSGEIAVRLGLTKSRVEGLMKLSRNLSEKQLKKVDFTKEGIIPSKKGKISYTLAKNITSARISNDDKRLLINIASKRNTTIEDTELLTRLISSGMSVHTAMKEVKNYSRLHPTLIVRRKIKESLEKKYKLTIYQIIREMLSGKIELDKELVYITEE